MVVLFCLWAIAQLFYYKALQINPTLEVGISLTPDRIIWLTLAGAALLGLSKRYQRKSLNRVEKVMGLFLLVATTSYLVVRPDVEYGSSRLLVTLFNIAYFPFSAYCIARRVRYDRRDLEKVMMCLSFVGLYLALTALAYHYEIDWLVWPSYILDPTVGIHPNRARGPFVDAGVMGRVLVILFLCGVFSLQVSQGVRKRILQVEVVLVAISVYLTYSRSTWLAFAIFIFLLLVLKTNMRPSAAKVAVLVVIAFLVGVGSKFSFQDGTLFSKRQQTVDYRMANYQYALEQAVDHPIIGMGFGRFAKEMEEGARVSGIDISLADGNHNYFLGLQVELGIAGTLPYVAVLLLILGASCSAFKQLDRNREHLERNLALIVIAVVCEMLFVGQFADLRFHPMQHTLTFWLAGFLAGCMEAKAGRTGVQDWFLDPQREAKPVISPPRKPATGRPALPNAASAIHHPSAAAMAEREPRRT